MKKYLTLLLAAMTLSMFSYSCSDDNENGGSQLTLSVDTPTIMANGTQTALFTVKLGEEDVTSKAAVFDAATDISVGESFSTTTPGTYSFYAVYQGMKSVAVSVTAVPAKELILSVDRDYITADNTDAATFTVMLEDKDVTADSRICRLDGMCLVTNQFMTTEEGTFDFHATYEDGDLTIESNTVTVMAEGPVTFDGTKALHKNVTFFTFTATWCGPCFAYKGFLKELEAAHPNDIVAVNFYSADSDARVKSVISNTFGSQLASEGRFEVSGYPTTIVDLRLDPAQPGYIPTLEEITQAYETFIVNPARVGIRVSPSMTDETLTARVYVGAKDAGTYKIGVLLTEDNITAPQSGAGNSYNHVDVFRANGNSNIFGDDLGTMASGDLLNKTYTFDLKGSWKKENLHVFVYVLVEEEGHMVIANAVKAAANTRTDFNYAE